MCAHLTATSCRAAPPRPGTAAAGTATARGPGPLSLGGGQNTYRFAQ